MNETWASTNSDPMQDIKDAIEQMKNAPPPPPVKVVSKRSYEWYKDFYARPR